MSSAGIGSSNQARSIVQVDVARIGGITPWLKTAHLAETFNMQVCPHYLMEIHVALCAAVPNAAWVEFIPQLDVITESRLEIVDGYALPSSDVGLGISWDWKTIERTRVGHAIIS
jgi:L-alanine-DL-glutamate epimerase-like enolase superfamily enzyme